MQGPSVKYSGIYISEGLLKRVELRETRSDWLLAVFDEHTARIAHSGDGAFAPLRKRSAPARVGRRGALMS